MKPIDERVDVNFMQALRCVGYRLPRWYGLKRTGFTYALALRYGLVGAAAAHQLLVACDVQEEPDAQALVHAWPSMVEEHVRWAVIPRMPFQPSADFPALVSRLAYRPLQSYLALYRQLCPLDCALAIARDAFLQDSSRPATEGWMLWCRKRALRIFREAADDSLRYALSFYGRREADLEELPEIALIGE